MALPQNDPKQRQPDITLAKAKLGWQPKIKLADGLKPTVDFFDRISSRGAGSPESPVRFQTVPYSLNPALAARNRRTTPQKHGSGLVLFRFLLQALQAPLFRDYS